MKITIEDLSKVYKNGNQALKDVNLEIESGMFGLLGPNGAGKTTLMRILVTLMKPSTGNIKVDKFDLQKNRREIRAMLGYLPQDFRFFTKLRTWEFLDYVASLAGLRENRSRKKAVDEAMLPPIPSPKGSGCSYPSLRPERRSASPSRSSPNRPRRGTSTGWTSACVPTARAVRSSSPRTSI